MTAAKDLFVNPIEYTHTDGLKKFKTVADTIKYNSEIYLHFFTNWHTNTKAALFNSKIKLLMLS